MQKIVIKGEIRESSISLDRLYFVGRVTDESGKPILDVLTGQLTVEEMLDSVAKKTNNEDRHFFIECSLQGR